MKLVCVLASALNLSLSRAHGSWDYAILSRILGEGIIKKTLIIPHHHLNVQGYLFMILTA